MLEPMGLLPTYLVKQFIRIVNIDSGFGPSRSFDDLVNSAGPAQDTMRKLHEFCFSLGSNVVEHVRAHRVVFGKSMAMRWFADISADGPIITVKLNEGRRNPPTIMTLEADSGTDAICNAIKDAYIRV